MAIRLTNESTLRALDGLVAFWMVLWLVVGSWVGYTVWQLSEVGDTVSSSGEAISSSGEALEIVGKVPVVGDSTAELGSEIAATGEDIAQRGRQIRGHLRQLSILLGVALALGPSVPILAVHVALRRNLRSAGG